MPATLSTYGKQSKDDFFRRKIHVYIFKFLHYALFSRIHWIALVGNSQNLKKVSLRVQKEKVQSGKSTHTNGIFFLLRAIEVCVSCRSNEIVCMACYYAFEIDCCFCFCLFWVVTVVEILRASPLYRCEGWIFSICFQPHWPMVFFSRTRYSSASPAPVSLPSPFSVL